MKLVLLRCSPFVPGALIGGETCASEIRHSQRIFPLVRIFISWSVMALIFLGLSFTALVPASAAQDPSTSTQAIEKAVSQLQAAQESLQQRVNNLESLLGQRIEGFFKRFDDINTNLEKRIDDINRQINEIQKEIKDMKTKNRKQTLDLFFAPLSLPRWVLIADTVILLLAVAAVALIAFLWRGMGSRRYKQSQESDDAYQDRKDLGQRGVTTGMTAGLTSATVLLAGAFVLLGLARNPDTPFLPAARTQVMVGIIWLIVSILAGVWVASVVSPKSNNEDVSRVASINIMLTFQLWSILLGGISLLLSLFLIT